MADEVKVPDIGDFKDVPIIEVHVKEGDAINAEDPLVTLESEKATMDVPAPSSGTVERLMVKVGDRVSEGSPILLLKSGAGAMTQPPSLITQQEPPLPAQPVTAAPAPAAGSAAAAAPAAPVNRAPAADFGQVHASPSVRRMAANSLSISRRPKGPARKAGSPRRMSLLS